MIDVTSHLETEADRTLADDVRDGLGRTPPELPAKHLYDARGSELFEAICELPEYYPTRAEREILEGRAADIAGHTGARELVELGSGAAEKARILLAGGTYERYIPVDVSESALSAAAEALAAENPGLEIAGVVADFERQLDRIPAPEPGRPRLVAFLGGTIGNLAPEPRRGLLRAIAALLAPGDHLLLGTDLVKDRAVLVAAYDDAAGVTAEFNRNVLRVIDRELDADFDPDRWDHVALWNAEEERIEMWLHTAEARTVRIGALGVDVPFAAGGGIRTEISSKFTRERLEADLEAAGLELTEVLTDGEGRYALSLSTVR
jgi:L-histidine Nalpha-methyltransferase